MAKDKELSTNDEVQRDKNFQHQVDKKEQVLDAIREVLTSSTESAFKTSGFEKNDSYAGVYGDGTKYGAGVSEEKFNIKIAGKTKSFLQKEIILGTKTLTSIINIDVNNNDTVSIEYKSPETTSGTDASRNTYLIKERINTTVSDISSFKAELQKLFTGFAKKELGYLLNTKIGVDDKLEKNTPASISESFNLTQPMKKLTIADLYSESNETLFQKNKKNNTKDLDKTTPAVKTDDDKKLFFDEEKKDDEVKKEITTAGPAGSGAGRYDTKNAWKKTSYAQAQEKRPTVTKGWNVVPESDKKESDKKDVAQTEKKSSSTEGGVVEPKSKANFDPKTGNGNYKNANQKDAPTSDHDNFWNEVKLKPDSGYVPVGMDQNFIAGMHDASTGDMKKRGYAEGKEAPALKMDLTQKKFFSLAENKEKGINKRYLITEKTTEEYEKERMSKLSNFKLYESIKEAEEMNEFFDSLEENKKINLNENVVFDNINKDITSPVEPINESDNEKYVLVQKPGSKFGTEYKFLKEDFMDKGKLFIRDINSNVYVPNPNK